MKKGKGSFVKGRIVQATFCVVKKSQSQSWISWGLEQMGRDAYLKANSLTAHRSTSSMSLESLSSGSVSDDASHSPQCSWKFEQER